MKKTTYYSLLATHYSLLILASAACRSDAGGEERLAQQSPPPPPEFEITGVIEGFYGTPWSHEDRLDMLRFMGRVGLSAYFYAPKDDPYHRVRWRDPYPADRHERLVELVETATANDVEFWYAISPGLSIVYSDPDDYDSLLHKIDSVSAMGVRSFALFLDDVPAELAHEADRVAFQDLAGAHVHLINRLQQDLVTRGFPLVVTPTTYTDAWGDRDYVERLGAGVVADVPFFWTGVDVAAPEITNSQASSWGELIGRKPLVWDNYPVNDYARWRPFLGPISGRAANLPAAVGGIVANPMNEAHASMVALWTLADYVRDPEAYRPREALRRALHSLYGQDAADQMAPFIDIYGDYGWDTNLFEPLYFLRDTIDLSPIRTALHRLEGALGGLDSTASAGNDAVRQLVGELEPFVRQAADRVGELGRDPGYGLEGNRLVYRSELDRIDVPSTNESATVDGDLSDWPATTEWHQLRGPAGRSGAARAAFGSNGTDIHIAIQVVDEGISVRENLRIGEGDHIALLIDGDPTDQRISSADLLALFAPPTATEPPGTLVRSMAFEGFMAKFLADNRALTFSEFHMSTFGIPPATGVATIAEGMVYQARLTNVGYQAEVAFPHQDRERIRLSLTVTDSNGRKTVRSLSRRNYPANPATYVTLVRSQK